MIELLKLVFGENLIEVACAFFIYISLYKIGKKIWLKYLMHKDCE